jgi:serine phosphatase RsbU (regulator of sigma subunit)
MANPTHYLLPIAGPTLEPIPLTPSDKPQTIGRHEACDLLLPATADKVSRFHAQFTHHDNRWHIADLKSRWGTFLNGRQLPPEQPTQLHTGDLLHIAPWTFSLSTTKTGRGLKLPDDHRMSTMIHTLPGASSTPSSTAGKPLSDNLLALLLESAAGIHNANDEKSLAQVLLDTAARGTGLRNGALLKPVDAQGTFEVLASASTTDQSPTFSRTLINAASSGDVAEFSAAGSNDIAVSIAQMNVTAAICVPLMLGNTVAAYLYLDARNSAGSRAFQSPGLGSHATAFCAALGKIASLALANLKRVDMERRAALVEAELNAGAEAQRFILPKRSATLGKFQYIGESKPGRYVGGDFFDILTLDDKRIALALADVAGKGIPASVLMAAAQGYLHSALQRQNAGAGLSEAASALNAFVCPRCPSNKFLTIFLAVLDAEKETLTYVDAGHGYGLIKSPGQSFQPLAADSSLPIGISADTEFPASTVAFPPGSELLIVSDGIIEQPAPRSTEGGREQFDVEGVQKTLATLQPSADPITTLFTAVTNFAGSQNLADDATALLVRYAC